jgi:hypothetical protein
MVRIITVTLSPMKMKLRGNFVITEAPKRISFTPWLKTKAKVICLYIETSGKNLLIII